MQVIGSNEMGQIIKLHRKMLGLTQFQLAELVETDEKQLGKIERGKHYPSVPLFLKLLVVLNIDIRQFYLNKQGNMPQKLSTLLQNASKKELELVYSFLKTVKNV